MAVDSVALKLPTFWVSSPLAWFAQAEAQFELRKITQDDTRYYHVVASFDTNTAKRALPIITAPPPTEKYKAIEDFLTSAYGLSDEDVELLQTITNQHHEARTHELTVFSRL
ncbi:retrovirus-related pol polyprotein [Plakobranchus ocellatus]|uniref:Retrovirus-related pol polyprotein n=1 Tax=Plakobranchus ocellatus TaxID=259542 RepID=A0AAV4DPZ3_9GAST|nr:retrovirus-related pol polyprotein [Plakobranchus ocellatus]